MPKVEKISVLICDDNDNVRLTLARALKFKKDIRVLGEASSFEELIGAMKTQVPDVILMDVNMSGTDGVEGIKALRGSGDNTPVILMSADERNEDRAGAVGAASFFYKGSIDLATLVENIRAAAG